MKSLLLNTLVVLAGFISLGFVLILVADLQASGFSSRLLLAALAAFASWAFLSLATRPSRGTASSAIWVSAVLFLAGAATTAHLYKSEVLAWSAFIDLEEHHFEQALITLQRAKTDGYLPDRRRSSLEYQEGVTRLAYAVNYDLGDQQLIEALGQIDNASPNVVFDAIRTRALLLRALGAYPEALEQHRLDIESEIPRPRFGLLHRAQTYFVLGELDKALEDIETYDNLWPNEKTFSALYLVGRIDLELDRYPQAIQAFTEYLELNDQDFWPHIFRGCTYAKSGNYHEALKDYQMASQIWSESRRRKGDRTLSPSENWDKNRLDLETHTVKRWTEGILETDIQPEDLCANYWDYGDKYRERSPLLPTSTGSSTD